MKTARRNKKMQRRGEIKDLKERIRARAREVLQHGVCHSVRTDSKGRW